jgi:uncharacterized protein YjdB
VFPKNLTVNDAQQTTMLLSTYNSDGKPLAPALPVTWTSSNSAVARIDASTGVLTGVSPGTVTITGRISGFVASTAVTVVGRIATVSVSASPSIVLGGISKGQATVVTRDAWGNVVPSGYVEYTMPYNPFVFLLDYKTGTYEATAPAFWSGATSGSAVITATAGENKTGTATIRAETPVVATRTVVPATVSVASGNFVTLTLDSRNMFGTPVPESGPWSSNNSNIAQLLDVSGSSVRVRGGAIGTATITWGAGASARTAMITVTPGSVASVQVSPPSPTISVGATQPFSATLRDAGANIITGQSVTWTSSDASVATISSTGGLATALKVGTTTISARSSNQVVGTTLLTVGGMTTSAVATVTINDANTNMPLFLAAGQKQTFTAVAKDVRGATLTGRAISWSSSAPSVVSVNSTTGEVTAVGYGTATITASSENVRSPALTVYPVVVSPQRPMAPGACSYFPGTTSPCYYTIFFQAASVRSAGTIQTVEVFAASAGLSASCVLYEGSSTPGDVMNRECIAGPEERLFDSSGRVLRTWPTGVNEYFVNWEIVINRTARVPGTPVRVQPRGP